MRVTSVRYVIIALTTLVAVLLYVDRLCLGFAKTYIQEGLHLSKSEADFLVGAFFYTYALGQIPGGWLSDRYGARTMLVLYLATWSVLTGLMGLADSLAVMLLLRFGCGLFEAGAYPACAGLIRRWIPYPQRGLASGIVSIGGRFGGAIVPVLTAYLMVAFVPVSVSSLLTQDDLLDPSRLVGELSTQPTVSLTPLGAELAPTLRSQLAGQTDPDNLVAGLNALLDRLDLAAGLDLNNYRLPAEAVRLFALPADTLTKAQIERRNRLLLETAFPASIRKVYGDGWRPVMVVYGAAGVITALFFWLVFRDSPRQHPGCSPGEIALIESGDQAAAAPIPVPAATLWWSILRSPGLALASAVQFGTNFGWIFIANNLPEYLQRVYEVPEIERGWMASLPFMVSLPMLLVGGWWTDWTTRRFGARLGRSLPLVVTRFVVAGAFFACIFLHAPWPITIAICVVSLAGDMGIPAAWGYCLDVGGRNVGLILGWTNMWGNLGAAVSPSALGYIRDELGWDAVFFTCGLVYVAIGIASFFIDAAQPLVPIRRSAAPIRDATGAST